MLRGRHHHGADLDLGRVPLIAAAGNVDDMMTMMIMITIDMAPLPHTDTSRGLSMIVDTTRAVKERST